MVPVGVIPYVVGLAFSLAVVGGAYWKGRIAGAESRQPEITALEQAAERSRLAALAAETKANEAAAKVRVEYRTRVETIVKEAEAAPALVEVIRRESDPNCVLPPAYRELWDGPPKPADSAAAKDSARVNAAPVPLADAAATAAEAKRRFAENEAKLIALQNYLSQIQEAPKPN